MPSGSDWLGAQTRMGWLHVVPVAALTEQLLLPVPEYFSSVDVQ